MALSNRTKTFLEWTGFWIFTFILTFFGIYGIVNLISISKEEAESNCANIAKIAGDKEYLMDNLSCYILNGDRIEKVN